MSFRDVLLQVGFLMAAAAGVVAAWALLSGELRREPDEGGAGPDE